MADNVMNMTGRNFTGDQVLGLVGAITHAGVTISGSGTSWAIETDTPIQGLDTNRRYASFREAELFLVTYLLNNDAFKNVISGVAA